MASRSDLNGKRVLVSGASGFTGRYLTQELKEQGCTVISGNPCGKRRFGHYR